MHTGHWYAELCLGDGHQYHGKYVVVPVLYSRASSELGVASQRRS